MRQSNAMRTPAGRRHALAAAKAQPDGKDMAQEGGKADHGEDFIFRAQQPRHDHGGPTLARIPHEGEERGDAAAGAQHVGSADVLRSVRARIRQREDAAHDHGERDRAGDIAPKRIEEGRHGRTLQYGPMDTIFIREFRVDAWVGIYEWEKQRAQTLEMEIEIGIPGNEVGRTDNIHDTVHYGEVVERIAKDPRRAQVQAARGTRRARVRRDHHRLQGTVGAAVGREAGPHPQRPQGGRDARAQARPGRVSARC
jgi:hypothetical protein